MNEELIKELVKTKLSIANTIIERLPPQTTKGIKNIVGILLESIKEVNEEINERNIEAKDSRKLDKITIE